MSDLSTLRPKLKQNTVFMPTTDGLLFPQEETSFLLKGLAASRWFTRLAPHLTGEHTLDELCAGLEVAQREMVAKLVSALLQRGILKHEEAEEPGLVAEAVYQRFRQQIEFIDHYADTPRQRFKAFRESRIAVVGSGEALLALAGSLLRNGLKWLSLTSLDGSYTSLRAIELQVEALRKDGIEVLLSTVDYSSLVSSLDTYDIVAFCTEDSSLKDIAQLNRQCIDARCPLLPAWTFAGKAFIGPLVKSGHGPCWLCAQMRFAANADDRASAALWQALALGQSPSSGERSIFCSSIARSIGNAVGFELFKCLSGALSPETEHGVILQELETLESACRELVRHPLCPVCSRDDLEMRKQQLQQFVTGTWDQQLSPGDVLERGAHLLDSQFGVCSAFNDDDLLQLPLRQTALTVASPTSPLDERAQVITYSVENLQDARSLAMMEAIRRYTQAIQDTRGMRAASVHEMEEQGNRVFPAQAFSTWTGSRVLEPHARLPWMPAFALFTGATCYVPAAACYPHSSLNALEIFERAAAGSAAGTTFSEILRAGLLTALGYQHLRDFRRGCGHVLAIDAEKVQTTDPDLIFLLSSVKRFGRPFQLFELDHPSPLHIMCAITTDSASASISTIGMGLSSSEAIYRALLEFLGTIQTGGGHPSDRVPAWMVPPLSSSDTSMSRTQKPTTTMDQVEDYLREQAFDVLIVNTTTPDIGETTPFRSGMVLLVHAAGGESDKSSLRMMQRKNHREGRA